MVQYTIRFSHLAGKDLQCDYLGKCESLCDYIGTGAEQHFNPPRRLQTVKIRQRHAQAEKNGGFLIAQFEQRLLLHPVTAQKQVWIPKVLVRFSTTVPAWLATSDWVELLLNNVRS